MNPSSKLFLASASPRRRELLATLGYDFEVIIPEIDETPFPNEKPRAYAERLAEEKACAVDAEGVIVAADTVVVHHQTILGKPVDATDARTMLSTLSGDRHEVITGVCVRSKGHIVVFSCRTEVLFRMLLEAEIDAYVTTGDPMDKAGAYAIQGGAAHMVQSISGSYTNVVGLPLCELYEALLSF